MLIFSCVCVCDAPKGARSLSSGSVVVLSAPRRLQGPARAYSVAYSMTHPNNQDAKHTFDLTGVKVPAGGVLVMDGANRHPRPRRLHGRWFRGTHMLERDRWQAGLAIRSYAYAGAMAERLV